MADCTVIFSEFVANQTVPAAGIVAKRKYWVTDQTIDGRRLIAFPFIQQEDDPQRGLKRGCRYLRFQNCLSSPACVGIAKPFIDPITKGKKYRGVVSATVIDPPDTCVDIPTLVINFSNFVLGGPGGPCIGTAAWNCFQASSGAIQLSDPNTCFYNCPNCHICSDVNCNPPLLCSDGWFNWKGFNRYAGFNSGNVFAGAVVQYIHKSDACCNSPFPPNDCLPAFWRTIRAEVSGSVSFPEGLPFVRHNVSVTGGGGGEFGTCTIEVALP